MSDIEMLEQEPETAITVEARAVAALNAKATEVALVEQARQIAAERAALEASKVQDPEAKAVADYAAAISAPIEPAACVNVAPAATETVAVDQPAEALALSGEMLSIEVEPAHPAVNELIHAVAEKFSVPMFIAAEWLVNAADEIAEYQ